ncbi:MAG: MaoC family dehydratase N-terminal domain-containing protein [Dehalococcoidia bacterium]
MAIVKEGEVYVGLDCGRRDYVVTPQMVQEYADAVQDYNPWYFGPSPLGGAVTPTLVRHSEVFRDRRWYLRNTYGNLHAKQEWELFHPIMVGDHITGHSLVMDRYAKRGRDYVVNEALLFADDGRLLLRGRTHTGFLPEGVSSGIVVGKEREKEVGRRFEVGAGQVLEAVPAVVKTVTLEMCQRFSGPGKNYHTDAEEARKLGFPDVVVQGMMPICFLSEMMTNRFGDGWYRGGRMMVNLVTIRWQGEPVEARGVVKELTPEGAHRRAHLEVWCQKPDGTVTIVGSASALVP